MWDVIIKRVIFTLNGGYQLMKSSKHYTVFNLTDDHKRHFSYILSHPICGHSSEGVPKKGINKQEKRVHTLTKANKMAGVSLPFHLCVIDPPDKSGLMDGPHARVISACQGRLHFYDTSFW